MSDYDYPPDDSTSVQNLLYNREFEEAVIGSILINPDAFIDVQPILKPRDFYLDRHVSIWEVFLSLYSRKESLDFLTVKQELENRDNWSNVVVPHTWSA